MKKLTILCDLDGICADLLTPWLEIYNREILRPASDRSPLKVEDIVDWDIGNFVPAEHKQALYDIISRPGLYESLKPLPGAIDGLEALRKAGHEVIIVTAGAKGHNTAAEKLSWCRTHLGLKRQSVIIAHRKEMVKGDLFIDDSPEKIDAYRAAWPDTPILTIAYPYNARCDFNFRVHSWQDTKSAWLGIVRTVDALSIALDRGSQTFD